MKRSALLLSGGLDSAALAAVISPGIAININYGQISADAEAKAASLIAEALGLHLISLKVDCSAIGSGQMSLHKKLASVSPTPEWWPFRNQLLATFAGPIAIEHKCTSIVFGTVAEDRVHADGRREFFECLSSLFAIQEGNLSVVAPAIDSEASDLIVKSKLGLEVLGWTHSCHASSIACGECRGCYKRLAVLQKSGLY